MRKFLQKWHVFCVQEKSHVVIAVGYLAALVSHNATLAGSAYGIAALMTTHKIYRDRIGNGELRHNTRHLARD